MKKNFLFGTLAVLLAGFWFGGASLADDVAQIGDTNYPSLAAAVSDAAPGATIKLLKDDDVTFNNDETHLKLAIPNYGIRAKCLCDFKAISFVETKITIFSETDIFGNFLGSKIQSDEDSYFKKRFIISNIMIHEQFGHILFSENKSSFQFDIPQELKLSQFEPSSPIETYAPLNEGNYIRINDLN